MRHGITFESVALERLAYAMGYIVDLAGIFILTDHAFKTASPYGLLGSDSMVKICQTSRQINFFSSFKELRLWSGCSHRYWDKVQGRCWQRSDSNVFAVYPHVLSEHFLMPSMLTKPPYFCPDWKYLTSCHTSPDKCLLFPVQPVHSCSCTCTYWPILYTTQFRIFIRLHL